MRTTLFTAIAAAGLLTSSVAFAGDSGLQQISSKSASDEIVCKQIVHEGIVTGQVVCHTRSRWDNIRRGTEREFNDFQLRALTNPLR